MNIQDWFPVELTGLSSLQSKVLSRVFSNIRVQKHQDNLAVEAAKRKSEELKCLHESERGEWKSWPKTQHLEN